MPTSPDLTLLDKMVLAVQRVRDRLLRASRALESAGIPHAVAGDNAVAAWVATVDASAVRNTPDVEILIRRTDLESAAAVLMEVGFARRQLDGREFFLDTPDAKLRNAVHLIIAGERVRTGDLAVAPEIRESQLVGGIRVVSLEALVRMMLTSQLTKDRVNLSDMLEIGLIDGKWKSRFEPELAARLQQLIDTPEQ
jgi:hypothetical protein